MGVGSRPFHHWLVDAARDVRVAARGLRRAPGFSAVAVITLALGLALITATTAVVNAYLIRSMPYPDADRLYHVRYAPDGEREPGGLAALDWRALDAVVELADYSTPARFYVGEGADRQEAMGLLVAPGTAQMLGVRARYGRALRPDDFRTGAEPVVMIGDELWRTRFAADPTVIGRTLRASRGSMADPIESFRIVGILPEDFRYARSYDRGAMAFALPLLAPRTAYMVRLHEGVPVASAQQVITAAVRETARSFPPDWNGVQLTSVHERYAADLRPVLLAITAAAGIVLLIVCVNVAVLTLLRSLRREKEVAVRVALGAGGGHLARILLAESVLISGAALVIGVAMSAAALRTLAPVIEERLGRGAPGGTSAISIDWSVLLVVAGAAVVVALLLSLTPMLARWRRSLADTLRRAGTSATDTRPMRRLRFALVTLEVAASLALLVGCGLMVRTVLSLIGTDLGYRTEHVMRARVALPGATYPDRAAFLRLYDQLTERLAAHGTPFALASAIPFYEYPQQPVEVDGAEHDGLDAGVMAAGTDYFALLGMSVRQGRAFTPADRQGSEPVAIISAALAERLWPDGNAVGRRIRAARPEDRSDAAPWRTVVGVVNDVRQTHTDADLDDVYLPFSQEPSRYASVYFRTDQNPAQWLDLLRTHMSEIDPNVLVSADVTGSSSLQREEQRLLAGPRFLMSLLTGFALFAALLAALGIFGVTAYAVQQRERELAIRTAIGATRRDLIALFVKDGGVVLACGVLLGLGGAAAITRLLQHQLHGVRPLDVPTLLIACAFMSGAVLLASWWPAARRGALRDPVALLKEG